MKHQVTELKTKCGKPSSPMSVIDWDVLGRVEWQPWKSFPWNDEQFVFSNNTWDNISVNYQTIPGIFWVCDDSGICSTMQWHHKLVHGSKPAICIEFIWVHISTGLVKKMGNRLQELAPMARESCRMRNIATYGLIRWQSLCEEYTLTSPKPSVKSQHDATSRLKLSTPKVTHNMSHFTSRPERISCAR